VSMRTRARDARQAQAQEIRGHASVEMLHAAPGSETIGLAKGGPVAAKWSRDTRAAKWSVHTIRCWHSNKAPAAFQGFQESTSFLLSESFSSFILIFFPEITDRGAFCPSVSG